MNQELESSDGGKSACTLSPLTRCPRPRHPWTLTPPSLSGYRSPAGGYVQPCTSVRSFTPRAHTAPPSPMQHRRARMLPLSPLAKQDSLDELRSTVKQATSSMESSTNDVRLLGQKMAAATERMSESVQDNAQALALLAAVVDRLQTLIAASRAEDSPVSIPSSSSSQRGNAEVAGKDHISRHLESRRGSHEPRRALSPQARSVDSRSSSSFSSSLSGSFDGPTTFPGTNPQLASCHSSSNVGLKNTKTPPTTPKTPPRLSNGLSEAAPAPNRDRVCCLSKKSKKKKKKEK